MSTRMNRTLLAAAALLSVAAPSQAYDTNGWVVDQPSYTGNYSIGDNWSATERLYLNTTRTDAGIFGVAWAGFDWSGNDYNNGGHTDAYAESNAYFQGNNYVSFGSASGYYYSGNWVFNSSGTSQVVPLGTSEVSLYMRQDGNYFGGNIGFGINVYERSVQVARTNNSTGSQGFGYNSAFESDNYDTSSYYGSNIGGRSYDSLNVLGVAGYFDGPSYISLPGSVVRTGDIALGVYGSLEGLYAKDGGWLDIRGDLTVGANGTVYIREGEITSDVYSQYNNTQTGHLGRTNFESSLNGEGAYGNGGILSVRQHFAQDMYASGYETLGFRDGAVNSQSLYLDGDGFQGGEGAFGSLRSITGNNVQNGNIGIGWNGSQYTTIGVDQGSTLTINGRINGVNGTYSNADDDLVLNVASGFGEDLNGIGLVLNGDIRSSVRDVIQVNQGFVVLNSANAMSGSYYATNGIAVVHNANALGANTAYACGGVIALDARNAYPEYLMTLGNPNSTANLTIANNFQIGGNSGFPMIGETMNLLNVSGNNTITGTVTVGTNGYVGQSTPSSDAAIFVMNGTSLTVANLDANKSLIGFTAPFTSTLTIATENQLETIGTFRNLGSTGLIDKVVKEGDGDAYLGTAGASLLTFEVNGGRLFIDSLSTSVNNFGTFQKDGSAVLIIQDTAAETDAHYGRYNVNAGTLATASGATAYGDVYLYTNGTLGGKGNFIGDVYQTGGTVAPGFSPGVLTVTGDYSNVGGSLELELAGTGVAGTAYDQLRVTGDIYVSNANQANYSVIRFVDINGFEAHHGDVFQVIANAAGNARNTYDKFDLSQTVTAATDRVLFDHSTGKAYGTGLTTSQNFTHYATNSNQAEIGRALWMEAIDYDKSGISGELPQSFIDSAFDGEGAAAQTGLKAWILTRHDNVLGEVSTDLGSAAIQMLTAASGAEGLDSLSPEAYSGFGEIAVRLNRNFAQLGATGRRSGDDNKWGFNLGYSGEQLTSNSTSAYTSYKASSDTAYLTGDLALGSKVHLSLSAGLDDGRVQARDFSGDTNTAAFGLGLSITPESKFVRFDLGASVSSTNFDAVRQGSYMSQDNQDAYAVAARVTFLPKEPSFNAVTKASEPAASKLSLIPYVGVSYASADVDAFVEQDVAGSAQLSVDGFKRRSLVGELGLNAEYELTENTTLTGVFAYEHEFRNAGRTDMNAQFTDLGVDDTDFAIRTDGFGANIFRLGVGVRQKLGAKASLGLSYDALLGSGLDAGQHIKADVSFRF